MNIERRPHTQQRTSQNEAFILRRAVLSAAGAVLAITGGGALQVRRQ